MLNVSVMRSKPNLLAAMLFWGSQSKIEVKVEGGAPAALTQAVEKRASFYITPSNPLKF